MKDTLWNLTRFAVVLLGLLLGHLTMSAQQVSQLKPQLPTGKWTLTTVPAEQTQRGVDVYSVTTQADKGLSITKVGVRNRSDKTVSGLKLGWRVVTLDDKLKVLAGDDTPLLGVAIPPGEWRVIEYTVANFAEVSRSFLRQGKLFGDFQIEISVVQVIYGDDRSQDPSALHRR